MEFGFFEDAEDEVCQKLACPSLDSHYNWIQQQTVTVDETTTDDETVELHATDDNWTTDDETDEVDGETDEADEEDDTRWWRDLDNFLKLPAQLCGGGHPKGTGKPKRKSLKTCTNVLLSVVNAQNKSNLSPEGPYGETCKLTNMKNTKVNRKRLRTFYLRQKLSHMAPHDRVNTLVVDDQKCQSLVADSIKRHSRRRRTSTYSSCPDTYCICQAGESDWQKNGAMVQCEGCSHWYHYKCICKHNATLLNKTAIHDKDVRFICGYRNCKYSEGVLYVKGAKYMLKKEGDISEMLKIVSDSQPHNELDTSKVETIPTDNSNIENTSFEVNEQDAQTNLNTGNLTTCDISDADSLCNKSIVDLTNLDDMDVPAAKTLVEVFNKVKNIHSKIDTLDDIKNVRDFEKALNNYIGQLENNIEIIDALQVSTNKKMSSLKKTLIDILLSLCNNLENKKEQYLQNESETTNTEIFSADAFSKETISAIIGKDIPSDYFTADTPCATTFAFNQQVWKDLYSQKNKRHLQRNTWQDHFVKGIKESNPHCSFKFFFHKVSNAQKKKMRVLFSAKGCCTFNDCMCNVYLRMNDPSEVKVKYEGQIKHCIKETRARNINGNQREELKAKFKSGIKPLKLYLDEISKFDDEQLISGNRDGLGVDCNVLSTIACEARQSARHDSDLVKSLISLKDEMINQLSGGFIKKISVFPMYILYWSNYGLEMFNDRARNNAVYWDATGSVVRLSDSGKKFLYYEMAISNPIKGKMGIPISAMLSENQSLPTVLDWLESFQHALKKKFGHGKSNLCPKFIMSDQSMVLILAALKGFDNETLEQYINRCYFCAIGKPPQSSETKTVLFLCISHFMKSVKRYLHIKDISSKKIQFFLYIIGILIKCQSLTDFQELLMDIFVVVGSKFISQKCSAFVDRLLGKINTFDTTAIGECNFECAKSEASSVNADAFDENDYQILGLSSPFKTMAYKVHKHASEYFDSNERGSNEANKYYCEIFIDYLLKRLLPIFPMWSSLLYSRSNSDGMSIPRTNSLIENRFRILKEICFQRRSKHRVDEFSEALKSHTIAIQKLAIVESLKNGQQKRKRKLFSKNSVQGASSSKKCRKTTLVKEEWDKRKSQSIDLETNSKVGKYQKPPKHEIKLNTVDTSSNETGNFKSKAEKCKTNPYNMKNKTKTEKPIPTLKTKNTLVNCSRAARICGMKNFGNTCWFNSVIQSLFFTNLRCNVIKNSDNSGTHLIDKSDKYLAMDNLINIWKFMCCDENAGKLVSSKLLQQAVRRVCSVVPGFSYHEQQDAQEFLSTVITDMSRNVNDNICSIHKQVCQNCNKVSVQTLEEGPVLILPLQQGLSEISIQTMIDNMSYCDERIVKCSTCNKNTQHSCNKTISYFPQTLMIVLGRFFIEKSNNVGKLQNAVYVNPNIKIGSVQENVEQSFEFKSAVCHYGDSATSGHYKAVVNVGKNIISCDDDIIAPGSADILLNTAYIVFYDRVAPALPHFHEKLIKSLRHTGCFQYLINHHKFGHIPKPKQEAILSLNNKGYTVDLEADLKFSVSNILHKDFQMKGMSPSIDEFYKIFLEYLLPKHNENSASILEELFSVVTFNSVECLSCCSFSKSFQKAFISTVYKFPDTENIFAKSLMITGTPCHQSCNCGLSVNVQRLLLSLPNVLVFCFPPELCNEIENFLVLDLTKQLIVGLVPDSMQFSLQTILCIKDTNVSCFKLANNSLVNLDDGKPCTGDLVKSSSRVYLLYVKTNKKIEPFKVLNKLPFNVDNLSDIELSSSDQFTLSCNILPRKVFGVTLNKRFYDDILSPTGWLKSDHLNVYLLILRKKIGKVHVVDSSWFSSRLCRRGNFIAPIWYFEKVEGCSAWFSYDFVVIPINENNVHWTVAVVDVKKKHIIYCNSFGTNDESYYICFQIWRYLCFDCLIHKNKVLNQAEWNIILYNESRNFPLQTDNSSCGVYVCFVVKAILTSSKLPFKPNLPGFRYAMAREIAEFSNR